MELEKKSKWLFIGGYIPTDIEEKIFASIKSNSPYAANSYQKSLISGFDCTLIEPLDIINEIYLGSFPKHCNIMFFKGGNFSHSPGSKDVNLSFVNISVLKQFINPFGEKTAIKSWIKRNEQFNKYIFIYGCGDQYVRFSNYIKKRFPGVKVVLCILDLPSFMGLSKKGFLRSLAFKRKVRRFEKAKNNADFYTVVSRFIPEKIGIEPKKSIVVDCLVSSKCSYCPIVEAKRKRIIYTGSLTKKYGILYLVNEFIFADLKDCDLLIYGDGEAKQEIIDISKKYPNVHFKGLVPQSQIQEVQRSATILVNPRKPGQDFTKYSFPIKTAEYMLSGRPVICYKLEAFENDYDNYLCYADEFDPHGLSKKIRCVLNMTVDELNEIGKKSYDFITKTRNAIAQVKKIVEFVENEN